MKDLDAEVKRRTSRPASWHVGFSVLLGAGPRPLARIGMRCRWCVRAAGPARQPPGGLASCRFARAVFCCRPRCRPGSTVLLEHSESLLLDLVLLGVPVGFLCTCDDVKECSVGGHGKIYAPRICLIWLTRAPCSSLSLENSLHGATKGRSSEGRAAGKESSKQNGNMGGPFKPARGGRG